LVSYRHSIRDIGWLVSNVYTERVTGGGRRATAEKREPSGRLSIRDVHPQGFRLFAAARRPSPVARRHDRLSAMPSTLRAAIVQDEVAPDLERGLELTNARAADAARAGAALAVFPETW